MKVLIVGGGGREHALAWKIAQSPLLTELYAAPGNAGIAAHARCVDLAADDIDGLVDFAARHAIDLTVVGPEAPLAAGLVDRLAARDLLAFGPTAACAQLEASKVHAKQLMREHNIPTARFSVHEHFEAALGAVENHPLPLVVKADGLAAGKGVFVCETLEDAQAAIRQLMREEAFGGAGARVLIEECLVGEEASILALVDGHTIAPLEPSQDHKRIGDGDTGPNTGGMGAYSPAPVVTPKIYNRIERDVLFPTLHALRRAHPDAPYRGLLYVGLMLTDDGPMVLEYNCRFGDPETQPILARLRSDLLPILLATARGRLETAEIEWDERAAVCVVLASAGYPGSYEKGKLIRGLDALPEGALAFHAGTQRVGDEVLTSGGRVLGITALGDTLREAKDAAYKAAYPVLFEGKTFRRDIADRGIARLRD